MGIKHRVNEQFFDTWSNPMAYVLGYIYADGHVIYSKSIRGKYTCVTSTDIESIQNIRTLPESEHRIYEIVKGGNYKIAYQVRIGSAALFDSLGRHGVMQNKSLIIRLPTIPKSYLGSFVRGYFDGDGCAFIERTKDGRVRQLQTIFTCGSKEFLEQLQEVLTCEAGIKKYGLVKHGSTKNAYQLRYSTRDSLRLYMYLYKPDLNTRLYLQRKYAIFREYLQIRNLTRADIPWIVETKGPVVKQKHD